MTMFTPQETKDLSKFLSYAENQDEALSLDGLHGFLFGLAGIPGMVAPSEWLPGIFGEGMRDVDDEKEGLRLLESLFSASIRIARQNQDRILAFPFGADHNESKDLQRIREWTRGLLQAISLSPKVWGVTAESLELHKGALEMTTCAAIVIGIVFPEKIPALFPSTMVKSIHLGSNPAEIESKLFDLLPKAAARILEHATASRAVLRPLGTGKATDLAESHRAAKIGRNDPCPCGSGVKYKKCCGK